MYSVILGNTDCTITSSTITTQFVVIERVLELGYVSNIRPCIIIMLLSCLHYNLVLPLSTEFQVMLTRETHILMSSDSFILHCREPTRLECLKEAIEEMCGTIQAHP